MLAVKRKNSSSKVISDCCMLRLQPPARNLAILRGDFHLNEVPARVLARHARGAGPAAVIQHGVTFVGVGADKVFPQGHGLLCGVQASVVIIGHLDDAADTAFLRSLQQFQPLKTFHNSFRPHLL